MKAAMVLKTLDHGSPSESHCDYSCQGLDRVTIELQWKIYCAHPGPIQCSRLNYPTTGAALLASIDQPKPDEAYNLWPIAITPTFAQKSLQLLQGI